LHRIDASPEAGEHELPSDWPCERFTVVDTGDGLVGLHSKWHNRFVIIDGDPSDPAVCESLPRDATSHPKEHWPCGRFQIKKEPASARTLLELMLGKPMKLRQLERYGGTRFLTAVKARDGVYPYDASPKCKGDRRNAHSSYAIVHTCNYSDEYASNYEPRWQFIPVDGKPGCYYIKEWGEEPLYLAAHQHKGEHDVDVWDDTRSSMSSYVCIHAAPSDLYRSVWQLVAVVDKPNVFKLQMHHANAWLAAHMAGRNNKYPDRRNRGSSYVCVHEHEHEGSDHVWASEWELSAAAL